MLDGHDHPPRINNLTAIERQLCFNTGKLMLQTTLCNPDRKLNPLPGLFWGKYPLTRICFVEYIKKVESVYEVIAEPNCRAKFGLLVSSQLSVGEIERQLVCRSRPCPSTWRVLRNAGFVESTVDAQRRLYRPKPEPLQEIDAWVVPVPAVLVRSRGCSRTPPRPHGSINTNERKLPRKRTRPKPRA